MGTVSIDLRALDRDERRAKLGGGARAKGSARQNVESNDQQATGKREGRLRGTMQQAAAANRTNNGGRFSSANDEVVFQELNLAAYPRNKRNGKKKSRNRNRRVTFAV
ncbi:PREDICTED: uncharacterized protein LOC107194553 [Dufourea novaeangliae]|uniref:Uncharacterized protein n=1 Tax=Dufourea novaeangliae TaxID=178035 RepID=A0A154P3C2_DUFNO|nr:PREDICTED: uncharacterized protein LOC107194553 [Dufourea novaeangliae]KZC06322.1 hypothetical protein WN55_10231 [Dufourea novaeangliae]